MKAKLIIALLIGLLIGSLLGGFLAPGIMAGQTFLPVAGGDYDYQIYKLLKEIQEDVSDIEWNTFQIMNK